MLLLGGYWTGYLGLGLSLRLSWQLELLLLRSSSTIRILWDPPSRTGSDNTSISSRHLGRRRSCGGLGPGRAMAGGPALAVDKSTAPGNMTNKNGSPVESCFMLWTPPDSPDRFSCWKLTRSTGNAKCSAPYGKLIGINPEGRVSCC